MDQSFYFCCLLIPILKCKNFMLRRGSFLIYYYHCCNCYYYFFCIGAGGFGSGDFLECAVQCCQSHGTGSSIRVFGWWSTSSSRRELSFAGNLGDLLGSNGSLLNALIWNLCPVFDWTAFQCSISSFSDMRFGFQYSNSSLSIVSSSSELTDILLLLLLTLKLSLLNCF